MARGRRPARLDVVAPAGGRYDNLRRIYRKNTAELELAITRAEQRRAKTVFGGMSFEEAHAKLARTRAMSTMTDAELDAALEETHVAMMQRLAELAKGGR